MKGQNAVTKTNEDVYACMLIRTSICCFFFSRENSLVKLKNLVKSEHKIHASAPSYIKINGIKSLKNMFMNKFSEKF